MSLLGIALALAALAMAQSHKTNPIEAALHMISKLQSVIISQGADAQKAYSKHVAFCEQRSRDIAFAIKTERAEIAKLKASIYSSDAAIGVLSTKIEEVSAELSTSEDQLKRATEMRSQEAKSFKADEDELRSMIQSLKQAISTFSKKEGASLLQTNNVHGIEDALRVLVDASAMDAQDAMRLTSLVQEQRSSEDASDVDKDEDSVLDSFGKRFSALLKSSSPPSFLQEDVDDTDSKSSDDATKPTAPRGLTFPGDAINYPPFAKSPPKTTSAAPSPENQQASPPALQIAAPANAAAGQATDGQATSPSPQMAPPAGPAAANNPTDVESDASKDVSLTPAPPKPGMGVGNTLPGAADADAAADAARAAEIAAQAAAEDAAATAAAIADVRTKPTDDIIEIPPDPASWNIAASSPSRNFTRVEAPIIRLPRSPSSLPPAASPSLDDDDDDDAQDSSVSASPSPVLVAPAPSPDSTSQMATGADDAMPSIKVYEGKNGAIVGTLEALLDKAEAHLEKLQGTESTAIQNFKLLRQSLQEELATSKKDFLAAKSSLPEKKEAQSIAKGDLQSVKKDLEGDEGGKQSLKHQCLQAAEEFQVSTKVRNEELQALAGAKKAIVDTTGSAAAQTYDLMQQSEEVPESFVQQRSSISRRFSRSNAVQFVRNLASSLHSKSLAQLASRMETAEQFTSGSSEPFSKVKAMLSDMIVRLSQEADSDVDLKSYCDKEMTATLEQKEDSSDQKARLTTKAEQRHARSGKLRTDISTLQRELASLTSSQFAASKLRQEEHAAYTKNKASMEEGLRGLKLALKILREHYGQDAQSGLLTQGASGGIIGLLEVVETDFTKGLAEILVAEETAATYYESKVKPSTEAEIAAKQHDMKLKMTEYVGVNKEAADLSNDAGHVSERLVGISQYEATLKSKCVQKDTFEERKARRDKETAGLKEALTRMAGDAAMLLQVGSAKQLESKRSLRGIQRHNQEDV